MANGPTFLTTPREGAKVEFWPNGMTIVPAERGIIGVYKDGRFWSHDLADHWAPREIHTWCYPA